MSAGCSVDGSRLSREPAPSCEAAGEAGVESLFAIIRPDNLASQGVATKIGLVLEREVRKNGGPALVFGADLG